MCFFGLLLAFFLLFFFPQFSFLFGFLLLFLFLFEFFFLIFGEFFEIGFAVVDNDLLSFFLVGEEVCISPEEAEDSIEEAVDVAFLLDHGHEDAVKSVVF